MNRGARMLLQLFAPAVVVAAGALALGRLPVETAQWPGGSYAPLSQCLQFGGLGAAAAMLAHSFWRLWRWERGREPQCPCGGLLSRPQRSRHGRLRRCLGCRRPHPEI